MEFHANRPELIFTGISIQELKNKPDYYKKYFVFLDEFTEGFINAFIRNVLRAAGIVCVVANTNTVITNLLGQSQSHFSGPQSNVVWCLVVNDLDHSTRPIIEDSTNINGIIQKLSSNYQGITR